MEKELWGRALYGDPCRECGFDWSITPHDAVASVQRVPQRYADLLDGRDATRTIPDLAWSAGAYVCHVVDNLRIWSERLAGAVFGGTTDVPGYDQDLMARARAYHLVPVAGALWSLRASAARWVEATSLAIDAGTVLHHAARGAQAATDVARNNAHDAHHHAWDISRILGGPDTDTDTDTPTR